MDVETLRQAWAILQDCTPLCQDCGPLCQAACCQADEDGQGGVYLFPGERQSIGPDVDWARFAADGFGQMLVCVGHCDRARRPLGCRIFPLTPRRAKDGALCARIDRRAFAMCPLARSGVRGLQPEFVQAVERALSLIDSEPDGRAFLERWMALEGEYAQQL